MLCSKIFGIDPDIKKKILLIEKSVNSSNYLLLLCCLILNLVFKKEISNFIKVS
jgi:hypothetical protein